MSRFHARRWAGYAGLWLGGAGCAATPGPSAEPSAAECSVRLPPRSGSAAANPTPTAERPTPPSLIVVHAETPLSTLKQTLEQRVQKRLAEGRVRIGPGGTVTYSAERGALTLSVTRTALVVETAVRARAEACRGGNCYASCEPEALVQAEVPLLLGADYRFQKAAVTLKFTRGCKVRTLGGLLTVDITPTLQSALQPELERAARAIDEGLPDITAQLSKAWVEVQAPRDLPLGGCFVAQPFGIVQGPLTPSTSTLQARFALLATPELRATCGEPPLARPLPPLTTDLSLSEEGVLRLALVTPLASVERAFVAATPVTAAGESLRITQAQVTARGSDIDADLLLGGQVCGDLSLTARLDFPPRRPIHRPHQPPAVRNRKHPPERRPPRPRNPGASPGRSPPHRAAPLRRRPPRRRASLGRSPRAAHAQCHRQDLVCKRRRRGRARFRTRRLGRSARRRVDQTALSAFKLTGCDDATAPLCWRPTRRWLPLPLARNAEETRTIVLGIPLAVRAVFMRARLGHPL